MTKKLNRNSVQRLKRLQGSVDKLQSMINGLDMTELEELIRRDEISVDTYGGFGGGSIVLVGRRTANSGSPVENAVVAKMMGRPIRDPLREALKAVEELIMTAEANLYQVHQALKAINQPVKMEKERRSSNPCDVCQVLPIMKTGFCHECYAEWAQAGAPDRDRWIAYKQHLTNSEGIVLITEQPAARHASNT